MLPPQSLNSSAIDPIVQKTNHPESSPEALKNPAAEPTGAAAPKWKLEIPPPRTIHSVADAVGALIYTGVNGDEVHQIQDVIWGLTEERGLGYAVLRTRDASGKLHDHDHPEAFEELIFDMSDLKDVQILAGENLETVTAARIRYQVGARGFLRPQFIDGQTESGLKLTYGSSDFLVIEDEDCCAPVEVTKCVKGDDGCQDEDTNPVSCPGPSNCACTAKGSCELRTSTKCNKGECGGDCPGTDKSTCKQTTTSNPIKCECKEKPKPRDGEEPANGSF